MRFPVGVKLYSSKNEMKIQISLENLKQLKIATSI